jgi:hypothetical protein
MHAAGRRASRLAPGPAGRLGRHKLRADVELPRRCRAPAAGRLKPGGTCSGPEPPTELPLRGACREVEKRLQTAF